MPKRVEEIKAEIPRILYDVKKFTVDFLGLSKKEGDIDVEICVVDDKTFTEKVKELGEAAVESFLEFSGKLYINADELEEEVYREKIVCTLSYYFPFIFVLEETPYGKKLREDHRIKSCYLPGVGLAVEEQAIRTSPGYRLNPFESKISEDLNYAKEKQPLVYEAYKFVKYLEEKVNNFDALMNPEARNRIVKAVLLAAGRDAYFDMNFKRLISSSLEELYELAGASVARPDTSLADVIKIAEEVKQKVLNQDQWRYIHPTMEVLGEKLRLKGLPLSLRDSYETHLKNCSRMESIEPFRKDLIDPTRELLEEVVKECKKGMDRPIKITFY